MVLNINGLSRVDQNIKHENRVQKGFENPDTFMKMMMAAMKKQNPFGEGNDSSTAFLSCLAQNNMTTSLNSLMSSINALMENMTNQNNSSTYDNLLGKKIVFEKPFIDMKHKICFHTPDDLQSISIKIYDENHRLIKESNQCKENLDNHDPVQANIQAGFHGIDTSDIVGHRQVKVEIVGLSHNSSVDLKPMQYGVANAVVLDNGKTQLMVDNNYIDNQAIKMILKR